MRNDFETGYLMHWGIAKGGQRKNHKYLERIIQNGRYIYFYTQAQLDAFLRRRNGGSPKTNTSKKIETNLEKKNKKASSVRASLQTGAARLEKLRQQNFTTPGKTKEEKQKKLEDDIVKGEEKVNDILSSSSSEKKSSKSKGSGSSSSGSKKSKSSGSSSSKKSSSSKAASAKDKTASAEKTTKQLQSQTKKADTTPVNLDTLKKIYGKKDEDVTTHNVTEAEFENEMLSKYDEGSFGYLMAGNKAYKWTIENGQLILKDFNTDKAISAKDYLKDVKEFKEFQTNKKKK